jgi:hypothetical protein
MVVQKVLDDDVLDLTQFDIPMDLKDTLRNVRLISWRTWGITQFDSGDLPIDLVEIQVRSVHNGVNLTDIQVDVEDIPD